MRLLTVFLICFLAVSNSDAQERKIRLDSVSETDELTEEQRIRLKNYLKGLVSREVTLTRNDYVNDYNRGTAKINREKGTLYVRDAKGNVIPYFGGKDKFKQRNYSYHKIDVQDGETIGDENNYLNFRQRQPETVITTAKNLTFINSNLTNVAVDPSWTLIGCVNEQVKFQRLDEDGKTYRVQLNKNKTTGIYEEVERHEIRPE